MQTAEFSSVDHLVDELTKNLDDARLSLERQAQLLSQIKIAGRQPHTARPLFSQKPVQTLSTYGLKRGTSPASKDALRSVANIFLLNESSRQTLVDLGYDVLVADKLVHCDLDEQFLLARLLFLLTYNTTSDFPALVKQHSLADSVTSHLDNHAASTQGLEDVAHPESMAMCELLRLLFNIQHFHPDLQTHFSQCLSPISTILLTTSWPSPPLQAALSSVINALLSLDLKSAMQQPSANSVDHLAVVQRLSDIFDQAISQHVEKDLELGAAPLCTLLRKVYEVGNKQTRSQMQISLLPTERDREQPLGQGNSFSARLLRLSNSPQLPTLRENISDLLYELSDQDPELFIRNVGYGYASGFLMSHNIAVPVDADDHSDKNTSSTAVNPITGQMLDAETQDTASLPDMTEEEKEREAERLFVLFERLKATGVVDVKNPVEEYFNKQ